MRKLLHRSGSFGQCSSLSFRSQGLRPGGGGDAGWVIKVLLPWRGGKGGRPRSLGPGVSSPVSGN